MTLVINQRDPPIPKVLEGDLLEKLLKTMSSLYDTDNRVLDLSALHKNDGNTYMILKFKTLRCQCIMYIKTGV